MKLYYIPQTSAFRPRWLLEELGLPHELIRLTLSPKDTKSPEYLQVHPLGQVPALLDDVEGPDGKSTPVTLIESAAICMYLAERDPARRFLPADSAPERAQYYQWIFYAMDTLSPIVHTVYLRWFLAAPEAKATVATAADLEAVARVLAPVTKALAGKPFLLGEKFSVADVVMGGVLQWANASGLLVSCPEVCAYHARLSERPAYKRALL